MVRIWVYSPSAVMNEALVEYFGSLGFDANETPAGAAAAVFDLTPFEPPLPPPPDAPCLALVRSPDPRLVDEAQRLGYQGVHRPADSRERLLDTMNAIVAGEAGAEASPVDAPPPEYPRLTPRETQVLGLLMLGLPNKRIAVRLSISERTVKHHVSALLRKFGERGRLGLLVKARARGAGSENEPPTDA